MGNICCKGCLRRLCPQKKIYTGIIIGRNLQLPEPPKSIDMMVGEEEDEGEEAYTTHLAMSRNSERSFSKV